jgi:hypothetical protein
MPCGSTAAWCSASLQKDSLKSITDITPREAVTLVPLVIATLFFGIYPVPIMEAISASVDGLITQVNSDLRCKRRQRQVCPGQPGQLAVSTAGFQTDEQHPGNRRCNGRHTGDLPGHLRHGAADAGRVSSRNNTDTINSLALARSRSRPGWCCTHPPARFSAASMTASSWMALPAS